MDNQTKPPPAAEKRFFSSRENVAAFLFFLINFCIAILWIYMILYEAGILGCHYNPIAIIIVGVFASPFAVYAIAEWGAFFRRNARIERKLGWVNLGCGALVIFGFISNLGEALMEWHLNLIGLAIIFCILLPVGSYLLACGLFRLRRTRHLIEFHETETTLPN